jgi:hypothetical protein
MRVPNFCDHTPHVATSAGKILLVTTAWGEASNGFNDTMVFEENLL